MSLLGGGFFSLQGKVQPKPSLLNSDFRDNYQQNHISECSNTFILQMAMVIWLLLAHFNFLLQLFFAPLFWEWPLNKAHSEVLVLVVSQTGYASHSILQLLKIIVYASSVLTVKNTS